MCRREFLKLAAGGTAFALTSAGKTADRLIPYIVPPEHVKPGLATFFATTCRECPAGCGQHLWHFDGRVTKAEGNPDHPVNHGALCARGQSALQGLYDPDRIRHVMHRQPAGGPVGPGDWETAIAEIGGRMRQSRGRVVLLSDLQAGALTDLMRAFAAAFGSARPLFYEPFSYPSQRTAHGDLFGMPIIPDYRIEKCDFVISFAADFLETWVSPVQWAQRFTQMHAYEDGRMGRLVYVGPRFSMTAANADDFALVAPGGERGVALGMLKVIVERGWAKRDLGEMGKAAAALAGPVAGVPQERIEGLAKVFVGARASVALPGPDAGLGPAARDTALAVALLNYAAGRVGQTVDFSRPHAMSSAADHDEVRATLAGLTADDVLVIHNTNPAHSLPGSAEGIRKAGLVVYLGTMLDETAALADWALPIDSPLESWGDYEPWAGYHSLMQPTMARLYESRPAGDVLLAVAKAAGWPLTAVGSQQPAAGFEDWLRRRWDGLRQRLAPQADPAAFWQDALRRGGFWEEAPGGGGQPNGLRSTSFSMLSSASASRGDADLWLWPHIMLYDGRFANRGWMQEVPEPVSYVAWGSLIDIHPALAARLGIADGDVVGLKNDRAAVEAPVRVTEDVAPDVVALAFGQGHTKFGRNADGRGANAFLLLGGATEKGFGRVTVSRTGRHIEPAYASTTQKQHGREVLQWVALSEVRTMKPGEGDHLIMPLPEGYDPRRDFYPPHTHPNHRWAMVVDLQRCIGCGACAAACYAENNLGVMGQSEVCKGREMAWMKVIPYRNQENERRLGFIPLMCQHCDAAPCEPVCPVFASVHDDEGLNNQVYNRCIGTRYCSNNCPYKVRHFNWLNIDWVKPLDLQLNPDVTVRPRGVMEKCTFCVHRIRRVEYMAKAEGRPVRDGEIAPACVQTCPARALIFGDLMNEQAQVTRLTRLDPRRYHVLEELNTKPAVAYLRRILRNAEA